MYQNMIVDVFCVHKPSFLMLGHIYGSHCETQYTYWYVANA